MKQVKDNCKNAIEVALLKYQNNELEKDILKRKSFKHHSSLILKGAWVSLMIILYALATEKNIPYSKLLLVVGILFTKDKVQDLLKIKKNRKKIIENDSLLKKLSENKK